MLAERERERNQPAPTASKSTVADECDPHNWIARPQRDHNLNVQRQSNNSTRSEPRGEGVGTKPISDWRKRLLAATLWLVG